jgi:hypothetical protein
VIDIHALVRRHQLAGVLTRIQETTDAIDMSHGLYTPKDGLLLPIPANRPRQEAHDRAKEQMQTLGTRIMETKMGAVLGEVTWGGDSDTLDDALTDFDLRSLARRLLSGYIVTGITGGFAHLDEADEPRISRLGGYIEPVTHPDDVDRVIGLYQAWQITRESREETTSGSDTSFSGFGRVRRVLARWMVRVYDWSESAEGECVMRQWDNLADPTNLGGAPNALVENHPRPRYRIRTISQDGLALGELTTALPQLHALWATEARLTLSEELSAFPMLAAFGDITIPEDKTQAPVVGPSEVWTGGQGSSLTWTQPGNLQELRDQRTLRLERIRDDLALPGGFLGRDSPSGEALREANVRFRQNAEGYARDISGLLTELVEDFAPLVDAQPAEAVVIPSQAYDEPARVQTILSLFREGLIPLQVAAANLQVFFPTWSDDDLNAWVEQQTAVVSVADFGLPGEPA